MTPAQAAVLRVTTCRTADEALNECRRVLGAPSRLASWWAALGRRDRAMLAKVADVPVLYAVRYEHWDSIPPADRVAIVNAARRAAKWAQVLVDDIDAYRPADALAARSERLVREGDAAK